MAKVLICDATDVKAVAKMQEIDYLDVLHKDQGTPPDELLKIVGDYDCLVVRSATKVTKEVIDAGKNLKLIVRGGVGLDNIDVAYAKEKGIEVRNTPAASSASVAELALAMMFSLARKLHTADASMKRNEWEKKAFKGVELGGKTLGIVGIGRIGQEVAKRAIALGMDAIAYDPYVKASTLGIPGIKDATLDEIIEKSDFITLHLPKTPETANMFSTPQFAKMKKTAYLINCARGGVVDEPALAQALKEGEIAGAGLDVFEKEPPVEHHFVGMDNVVLTPHVGAQTKEGMARVGFEVVDIVRDYFAK
jgi:D-3-phosphoglycerate dehydrogenase / 2-oxoglutarate reductase